VIRCEPYATTVAGSITSSPVVSAEDAHGIGFGEKLESHVTPLLAPLVVLLGEHRADEADDRPDFGGLAAIS
jgi:hypothetical protein